MRRILFALLATIAIAPTVHAAQGVNLRWDACLADGGVFNKNFACDTNTGSEQLFVSYQLDSAFAPVDGVECFLRVDTPAGAPGA